MKILNEYRCFIKSIILVIAFFVAEFPLQNTLANSESKCSRSDSKNIRNIKDEYIQKLVFSETFKYFVASYPASSKFAFPLEFIDINLEKNCSAVVAVYLDEDDHLSLLTNFYVNKHGEVTVKTKEKK